MKPRIEKIKVLLLDEDPLVHLGLEKILTSSSTIQLVGKAQTYEEAYEILRVNPIDILLIDEILPDRSGAEACRDITEAYPDVRVIFLACHQDKTIVYSAILAGASGFLLKQSAQDRLIPVLDLVANGHSIFEQGTLKEVQNWVDQNTGKLEGKKSWDLSPQQTRVVELVAKGKTNKEIASVLNLSEKTVRNYLATVFKKLHVSHRTRVVSLYHQREQAD